MNNSDIILTAVDIHKRYKDGPTEVTVLKGVNLELKRGECITVMGASGSGKSTLLHCLGGLDQPSAGKVSLLGHAIHQLNDSKRAVLRNKHIGFIFQFHHLLQEFTAEENVAMPLFLSGLNRNHALEQSRYYLEKVGLSERLLHKPSELSGGERQRVAIARALVNKPACVLADEPTGNLDTKTAETVYELLLSLSQDLKTCFLFVTHDEKLKQRTQKNYQLNDGVLSVLA